MTDEYEGKAVARVTGLFQQVLGFVFDSDDLLHDIERFEKQVLVYETASETKVEEVMKSGVLIRNLGKQHVEISRHITMNSDSPEDIHPHARGVREPSAYEEVPCSWPSTDGRRRTR